jgi:hypothetical protein
LVSGVAQAALLGALSPAQHHAPTADREAALAAGSSFHSLALFAAAWAIDAAVRLSLPRP